MIKSIVIISFLTVILTGCFTDKIPQPNLPPEGEGKEQELQGELEGTEVQSEGKEFFFEGDGLKTNTAKKSIELNLVLDGGPGKDGIPAINNPKFLNIIDAMKQMDFLKEGSRGMLLNMGNEVKFYPLEILVWHEIVNDEIAGKKVAVTFCPLCGSAIVYERMINGVETNFGVSGKPYQSNLLMYDELSESLWSQTLGEAVVGDFLGTKLDLIKSDLLNFDQFKSKFPNGKVLSDDTGYSRSYGRIPYGDYDDSDDLYFHVINSDLRFHIKEIFYIANDGEESLAFHFRDLKEDGSATQIIGEKEYTAVYNEGLVDVRVGDRVLPGYFEMWFSRVNHNTGNKNVWSK